MLESLWNIFLSQIFIVYHLYLAFIEDIFFKIFCNIFISQNIYFSLTSLFGLEIQTKEGF